MENRIIWDPDRVVLRMVNFLRHQTELEARPHRRFGDMALIYQLLLHQRDGIWLTAQVTWDLIKQRMDEQELYETACANSRICLPPAAEDIREVLKECVLDGCLERHPKDIGSALIAAGTETKQMQPEENWPMYVVTNQSRLYGAAVLFYSDILDELAKKFEGDLLILPSSIHEVLVLPYMGEAYHQAFLKMVRQANQTVVLEEEILSDSIYRYDRRAGELCQID